MSVVLCLAAQPNGLGTASPTVKSQTAARAKLSSANLAQATLKAGHRCMLYDPIVDWIFVPGPMQDGSGTPGQVSCSGMGSVLSSDGVTKSPCPLKASLI